MVTWLVRTVRSLAFYLAFYGLSIPFVLVALLALPLGEHAFRAVPNAWSRFHRWCVVKLLGIRVVEEGLRIPGPVLYAYKHESFFEALDLPCALQNPVPFAKAELFRIPLWSIAARRYGTVPVERSEGSKALRRMLAEAQLHVAQGRALVIFPEGTRVPHGERRPLRSGFAALYKLLGLPVVPVAVDSGPAYHPFVKQPGTITLRFGEPIPPGLPRAEIEARVFAAINALNS